MTFRGSLSNINSALNGLIFRATLNYVGAAGVTITTNDLGNFGTGGPLSDTDSVNITVTPVNDAPVNTVPAAQNTPEETALLFNTANGNRISVGDVDDADNGAPGDEPIQVSLTALNGVMTLGTTAGLSFSFSDANGTGAGDGTADATMTFRGTLNAVNQALNGMSFLSPLNFVGAGKVTIATNDLGNFGTGGPLSDTDSVNITVTPVNDAPVNTVPAAQSAIEDMPVTLSTANADVISVSDVDDGDNAVAGDETVQVTLTGLGGVVTLNSVLGLSFAFADANGTGAGDGTGDAIMTFRGTLSNVNAALDGLRFDPTPNFVGVANVAITTNDLGNFGAGGPKTDTDSVAITYSAVNDAPQNTLPAAQDKLEDVPLVFSSASGNAITIGDVDDADNGIPGDEIVQVSLNAANGDLTLSNTTGLDFGFVDANGTGAGDGTADTTMTFRGTLSDINAALNGLLFHSPQDYFGPASVSVSTNDLGNFGAGVPLSDADTLDITVEPVNDAPTFNVPANPPTIGQGAGAQSVANFTTGMSTGPSNESSQSLVAFNVTQLSSTGSIAFLAPPSIDPVTGTLTYQPTATAFGTATFSVTLTDNGPGAPPPNVNTSAVQTFTLTILLPSFVGLTPTPTNPLHGQTSSLAIAVIGSPGGPPTGTVTINDTFNSTTTILQSNVPLVAGGVNFDLGILATGTHSLQVFYSGDNVFAPSNKIITYVVGPAATSTALSSSTADPTIFGNAVVFTAVVSVTSGGTPGTISGTVEFREGVTLLGTATAPSSTTATTATYLFSYSNLTANGSVGHTVTAVFRGSNPSSSSTEDFGASPTSNGVVRHVLAANTTTVDLVAAPASPSNFGQPVTFTAKVTASNSPAIPDNGSVVFRNGTVILGTGLVDSTGHATITTLPTALAVGTRSITATYVGGVNFNASVQSPPLLQVVRATTSTTLTSNRLYWAVNQPVTFTATVKTTVSGAPAIPPGGTVTFIIDGVSQSPTHLNTSGKFQKVVTFATPGLHLVSAIFNPPNQYFTTSTAPELKQDNVRKATVLSLASSLPTSVIGQTVRFGAKIVGAGGIPIAPNTETISFFDNGVLLATVFLNTSGVAYFSTSSLTLGTHVITATYSGDANFNPAIRKLSQIVTKTGGRLV
jgi:hypothetical protein